MGYILIEVLGQLPPKKIDPNPKASPNLDPNPNLYPNPNQNNFNINLYI